MRYLILLWTLLSWLEGAQPLLGTLVHIKDNRYVDLRIEQTPYRCQPYGVETLEELSENSQLGGECKDVVIKFYRTHPQAYDFAKKRLRRYQRYHLEIKKRSCIMYVMGRRSYAELLLEEGLAMKVPSGVEELWEHRLERAQYRGRSSKKGIWGEMLWNKCAASLYSSPQ